MRVAHLITRRAHLAGAAIATALAQADHVVVGAHNLEPANPDPDRVTIIYGSDYIDLTNHVLAAAADHDDHTLRIDDDDWYPADHHEIERFWEPGSTVWGKVRVVGCDGTLLRDSHHDMCAGILPTGITLTGDDLGRVADSLRTQTEPVRAPTGAIKHFCLADTSWVHSHSWQRRVDCRHETRGRAQPPKP